MWPSRETLLPAFPLVLTFTVLFLAAFNASTTEVLVKTQHQDDFLRLAKNLTASGDIQRRDFAWVAISELIGAYKKVLEDSASTMPTSQENRYKLNRWRQATREFVIELQGLLDLLSTSAEVLVNNDAAGYVTLFVNNQPIVISGPELNRSRQMERRIVDTYCKLHNCDELLFTLPQETIGAKRFAKGTWIFKQGQDPRYETSDGLVFLFSSLAERKQKQRVCEKIANELRLLASDLRDARRVGIVIDWDVLEIQPLVNSDASYVLLNKQGDYLSQKLPFLEMTKLLNDGAFAWTRKMVEGEKYAKLIIHADHLMHLDIPKDL